MPPQDESGLTTPDGAAAAEEDALEEVGTTEEAGLDEVDAGFEDVDAGLVEVDAGLVDVDAGLVDVDAGLVDVDAGLVDVDAGLDEVDATDEVGLEDVETTEDTEETEDAGLLDVDDAPEEAGLLEVVETLVEVDEAALDDVVDECADEEEVETQPLRLLRYQLMGSSPKHSPTVTANLTS